MFFSAKYMSHKFEAQAQSLSSLLPETSVFDTLTDSILGGELDVSLLTNKNVGEQIRRGELDQLIHTSPHKETTNKIPAQLSLIET